MTPRLPRVTEILADVGLGPDYSAVPLGVLEAARLRGSAVHAAIEADHYGYPMEIPPDVAPYLDGYRKFLADSRHEPIRSEFAVEHPSWHYVGHPDRLGWLLGKRCLLDWKCMESVDLVAAGYQLTLYRLAWNAEHPTELVEVTAVVQFRVDGSFSFHEIATAEYEQVALAAIVVYQAKKARRAQKEFDR